MLKAKIVAAKDFSNHQVYYSVNGERLVLPEMYELELPFYAVVGRSFKETEVEGVKCLSLEIEAAFQKKEDLINWMSLPLMKNAVKEILSNETVEQLSNMMA